MFRRAASLAVFSLAMLAQAALADAGRAPKPALTIENPGECVAPVAEMRRNHMDMLKHQRDRTMRHGERGAKASLNGCVDCHASKTTGSVLGDTADGRNGFCGSCHAYAAVKIDCWDCHQPKAKFKAASAAPTMGLTQ